MPQAVLGWKVLTPPPSELFSYFFTIWSQDYKFHPHFRTFGLGVLPKHLVLKSIAAVGILNVSQKSTFKGLVPQVELLEVEPGERGMSLV